VLKEVAACIRSAIRLNDTPARYGGEEFTVIIPETDERGAMVIAERIRTCIERHVINSLGRELHVTVSIGCAAWPTMVSTQQELIDCADQALYFSKEHGRNQVTLFNRNMKSKSNS
ncbi:MAG: GGDEF domain-containing protein, partial [Fibrobacter sp.]|nr:GGDEF domain-containing protein [Fibrobacter sp.]